MLKILLQFCSIVIFTNLYSQSRPKTILWEVTQKGTNLKSYLFGTLHEVDPDFFGSLANSVSKLKSSDILYVEETSNVRDTSNIFQGHMNWSRTKWNEILSLEQKEIFDAFIGKAERSDFYNLPPFIISRVIAGMYLWDFCQFNGKPENLSLDEKIEELARRSHKPVLSLDENQADLLTKASIAVDSNQNIEYTGIVISLMSKMLNDDTSYCNIITEYKAFSVDYMLETDYREILNQSPLIIDRNAKWVKILDNAMRKNNCFIAVGIKHLFYKQGLIQQLRGLGYQVNPIAP